MKKIYRVDYENQGTIVETCVAWVEAESKDEAIKAVKTWDWQKIKDTDTYDTDYLDDFEVTYIESVTEEDDNQ